MAGVTTLDEVYWPLMELPSIRLPYCAVCGRNRPIEQHHFVFRSAGELYRDGRRVPKSTVSLCGFGSNLRDADGIMYCHGKAHHRMLHFRNSCGAMEYLETEEPTDYLSALEMEGWREVCEGYWQWGCA